MATDKYPQRNVNMPMDPEAVAAARAKLDPGHSAPPESLPMQPASGNGKGSRREIRKGEWIDDRVIIQGGPASPSADSPPEWKKSTRELPIFDPAKAYQVTLGKPCIFAGRVLSPAKAYQMTGDTCLDPDVQPCIVDAVELGDTPSEPDVAPSQATSTDKAKKKA
jgi:hypothetical protein